MDRPKIEMVYEDNEDDTKCGIGGCKPKCLQLFAKMAAFVGVYSISSLLTSTLNIYIASQITTLEKQFGLSSAQTGFILSCNDIGYLSTTLFASYLARRVHIPRILFASTMFYGVAGIVASTAYFVSIGSLRRHIRSSPGSEVFNISLNNSYESTNTFHYDIKTPEKSMNFLPFPVPMCSSDPMNSGLNCTENIGKFSIGLPNEYTLTVMVLISIGMLLQGVGKAPRYPLIASYIDDNVKQTKTPMFVGITTGIGIFGPAIAFACGGLFSNIYVTLEETLMTPTHPEWIGAWWLGFMVFGVLSLIAAIPLLFFPRRMKRTSPLKEWQKPQREKAKPFNFKDTVKDVVKIFHRLSLNSIFVLLVLGNCLLMFSVAGMVAFSSKYMEVEFHVPTWKANILMGAVAVVSASMGTVIGGCVTTKFRLHPVTCFKLLIAFHSVTLALSCLGFYLGCPTPSLVGFNKDYDGNAVNATAVTQTCESTCNCDSRDYFPVCGSDGMNYFSPCYAGCSSMNKLTLEGCSCIGVNGTAAPGLCKTECGMLFPALAVGAISNFFSTFCIMPMFTVFIRCVQHSDKAFAVGLSAFLATLLGWFPGPVVFGKVVDTACILWRKSCLRQGACALYDNDDLRYKLVGLQVLLKILPVILFIIAFIKARRKTNWSIEERQLEDVETVVFLNEKEMKKTPTDWDMEPIYKGRDQSKKFKSFSYQ
ncbi:hypothetical protein CHS0354_028527 [Potamilus streckersoni]|uniref:Solute carrier organic anion transporter family member n=1 Tax=Potamilus streckersoni TaxID=2493646 RepID=A0AAE0VF18_9BIVA|nr:hypothetical protein CHS0354_028527 [Potamilus streckersoni]